MLQHSRTCVFLALLGLVALSASLLEFQPQLSAPPPRRDDGRIARFLRQQAPVQPVPLPAVDLIPPGYPLQRRHTDSTPEVLADFSGSPAIVYKVRPGESIGTITYRYLPQTIFMTTAELEAAIRQANPAWAGTRLRPGQELIVPGIEPAPIVERPVPMAKDREVRAIYLTGLMAGSPAGLGIIRRWQELGGNAIVFDVKDMDGIVSFPFDHPLAPRTRRPYIRNLPKFTRYLHRLGLHVIARISLFRDEHLARNATDLAVRSRRSGLPWRESGKQVWVDPSRREVQDYNLALARQAANSGVDEVQFDYVRFPAEGEQTDAAFHFQTAQPDSTRAKVITGFLERAYKELHPLGVLVSLDVFGVMAWQRSVDLAHTGQDIVAMSRACDVLSPMIYPSHFFGMDGFERPGDAPEHFISSSMRRFREITASTDVVLRPWLQAFAWRTRTYSPEYVRKQVAVANQHGGIGYLLWNARNDYSTPFRALREARNAQPRPGPKEKAAVGPPPTLASAAAPGQVSEPQLAETASQQVAVPTPDRATPGAEAIQ